jgi:hypothetical protein
MKTFSSKKSRNLFLAAALVVGSLVFNVGNAAAQGSPIKPVDPSYQDSVEVFVGTIALGARIPIQLSVDFVAPTNVPFTTSSYTFTSGKAFKFRNADIVHGTTNDSLYLTIDFVFTDTTSTRVAVDTLIISAVGAKSFVLPLRGTISPFGATSDFFSFAEFVEPGSRSTPEPLTIIGPIGKTDYHFNFTEGTNAFEAKIVGHYFGIYASLVFANVWFEPPVGVPVGTFFQDTLVISYTEDGTIWVQKIPVSGRSLHIEAESDSLDFGSVATGNTKTWDLKVKLAETEIIETVTTDVDFSASWDPANSTIRVTFTPQYQKHYDARLVILGANYESFTVFLKGEGKPVPTFTAQPSYDFGNIEVNRIAYSSEILITLNNPLNQLDYNSFYLDGEDKDAFDVVGVKPIISPNPDFVSSIFVTLSFNPERDGPFEATLFVKADYADTKPIKLFGESIILTPVPPIPDLSPQQTTAISGQEVAAAPIVSTKDGNITVSGAPVGSSIQVYNLHGQSLKAQTVTSNVEILKTASLPQSVYVVLVNDKNQEILRKKVVL